MSNQIMSRGANLPPGSLTGGVAPESEVDSQITALVGAIDDLNAQLDTLGVRLAPVLSPYGSGSCTDDSDKLDRAMSPIADRVRTARYRVASLTERVNTLLAGLAV